MGRHRPLASGTGSVPVGPVPPPWDDEPTAPADGRAPGAERPAAVEASEAGSPGEDAAASRPTLLDQMGGPMGMVDSGLPVVVFVVVNVMAGLTAGIIAALAAGVVIAAARLANASTRAISVRVKSCGTSKPMRATPSSRSRPSISGTPRIDCRFA